MNQKIEAIRQRRRERAYLAAVWNAPHGPMFVMEPQKTLRDEFAMQALAGICAHVDTWGLVDIEIAAHAYKLAELMLEARK